METQNPCGFGLETARQLAKWYIDTNEKLAYQALDLYENSTAWAKNTPLAPIIAAQSSVGRKLVESSVATARAIWQLNQ